MRKKKGDLGGGGWFTEKEKGKEIQGGKRRKRIDQSGRGVKMVVVFFLDLVRFTRGSSTLLTFSFGSCSV